MSSIDLKRFFRGTTPGFPFYRDAYQIAENTSRSRHSERCRSFGIGALVTDVATFPETAVCTCWVVYEAQEIINRNRATCTECLNGCECHV